MAAARSQGGRWALFPDRTASRPSARALRPRSLAVMASTTRAHPIPSTSGCGDLAEEIGRDLADLVARLRVIASGYVHDDGVAKAKAFAQPLAEIELARATLNRVIPNSPAICTFERLSKWYRRAARAAVTISPGPTNGDCDASSISGEGRGLPALAGRGMPATAKLSEPVPGSVLKCCSRVTPDAGWSQYTGWATRFGAWNQQHLHSRMCSAGCTP